MKISLTQISISDRVQAAKINPSSTDTSQIPSSMNPPPGDSTIAPIDATGINRAGRDVNAQTQQGNRATSDSGRKSNNPANKDIQYDKQTVSSADQAPTANKSEDLAQTPAPKSKGFRESLMDQQMKGMMSDKTGGDHPAPDRDYGHDNGDPNQNVKSAPEAQPISRNKMSPYDNSRNRVAEPGSPPITSFEKENNMEPYKAPKENFGPSYNQKSLSAPKIKFNSPRINTPRFK